jgi:hypothetical protein
MVEKFDDPAIGIVGTEYRDEMRGARKYLDYPTVIMAMLRTKLLDEHKIDFSPRHDQIYISNNHQSIAFGRRIGSTVQPDSGFELAYKLRPAGVKSVTLKYIHEGGALPIGQNFCSEGFFANHMKSGSIQSDETIQLWKNTIDAYVAEQR